MQSNVIVVGMARSGTSLTASIFAKQGYFVSEEPDKELKGPDKFNPSGYWELENLVEANASLLRTAGFNGHNTWTSEEITSDQAEAIGSISPRQEDIDFVQFFESKQPWVWKDPRFCYTLIYWWPLLNPETTKVLLVTRSPQDIWRSFQRTKWRADTAENKMDFMRRIGDHVRFARNTLARLGISFLEVDYSDYANNPKDTAEKLSVYFGMELSADDLGYRDQYNNATPRGFIENIARKVAALFPESIRRFIKQLIPAFIARKIFPTMSKS